MALLGVRHARERRGEAARQVDVQLAREEVERQAVAELGPVGRPDGQPDLGMEQPLELGGGAGDRGQAVAGVGAREQSDRGLGRALGAEGLADEGRQLARAEPIEHLERRPGVTEQPLDLGPPVRQGDPGQRVEPLGAALPERGADAGKHLERVGLLRLGGGPARPRDVDQQADARVRSGVLVEPPVDGLGDAPGLEP